MGPPASGAVGSEPPQLAADDGVEGRAAALRRHPAAAAALVYAVLTLLFFAPALLPGHTLSGADFLWSAAPWSAERPADVEFLGSNFELADATVVFEPFLQFTRAALPDPPLWNPHIGVGRPYLGDAQSAIFSPFNLPAYLLPFWWSLGLIAVLKVFVASFGSYLLGRALGMRFGGALLAGIVYAFSLFFVVWIAWPLTSVWALLPWLLLLTERVIRGPTILAGTALAAVVALQFFGGHPESSFHVLGAVLAYFGFRLVGLRREGTAIAGLRLPALAFAAAMVGGTLLAAATLAPLLELLFRSNDLETREAFSKLVIEREYVLGLALPDYWGRATEAGYGAFAQTRALYAGSLPLLLALVAIIVRPSFGRVGVAAFGALMLAIAFGVPPLPEIAQHIPVVKTGNHLRVIGIVMLCIALLAGWGLDDLSARRIRRRREIVALAVALLVLPALALALGGELSAGRLGGSLEIALDRDWPDPPLDAAGKGTIRQASLLVWIAVMGLGVLLVVARLQRRLAAPAFLALALALVAADLFRAGMGYNPAISTDRARQPSTAAIEYLQARSPNRFVGLDRPLGPSPLLPDLAMRWSLYDARAYDFPVEQRYDRLWRRAVLDGGPTDTPTTSARLTERSLPALRLLSVTDVVQDPDEPRVREPALPLAYDGRDLRVYANARALPRAGVVDAQRVVAGADAQLEAVLEPSFDGRRTLVTGAALPGLRSEPGEGPAGSARIVDYERERVVVDASARRPSELVLTDLHYPGWKVKLDGAEANLHRVDYLLRGTTLPPGRHRVEFTYEPRSWRAGWIVSLLALVGLLACLTLGLRRGRRAPAPA